MSDWRRPHGITGDMILTAALLPVGLAAGAWFLYQVSRSMLPQQWPFAAIPAVMVTVWLAAIWRWNRAGVFVSDQGIRIRRLFRTRTLPWESVIRIDSAPTATKRFGFRIREQSIWVLTQEKRPIETPLVSADNDLTFLFQEWRAGHRTLPHPRFEQALLALRQAHLRALGLAEEE